jgi:TolB-like protein/DNA-binding winged helix-turn-helix (wHTH) protein/Flp pilus assembly protein TadD
VQKTQPNHLIRFGVFEVDPRSGELWSKGSRVKLQDQPLQILLAVLEKPGEVVTREELRAKLWPADTFVDFDHGLNAAVKRLRDALGDTAENPRYIETLPRRGYRFIAATVPDTIQPEKRQPPPRRWGLPIVAAAVVVSAVAVVVLDAGGLRSKLFSRSAAPPQIRSLAVLPLTNLSGDPQQEYFADGMTEELIGELSRISALKVISRTSVMQYKGEKKKPLPQIGRELNVDAVVEGSVLRSGSQVRIAAHMIYAPTDQNLMTETYESDLGDVLKLQREVAGAIMQKVKLKLTAGEKARLRNAPEVHPEAYKAYLQATYLDWALSQENEKARSYLEKAIQEDPGFAEAYVGLAITYVLLGELRLRSPQHAYPPAKQAIREALALDEKNCRAHETLARIAYRYEWDWRTAEKEFQHNLDLCPNDSGSHWNNAIYLASNGRVAQAQAEMARYRELDPVRSEPLWIEAAINYHSRNYNALTEVSRSFTTSRPNIWFAHYFLGVGYEGSGQLREAIPEYQKAIELSQGDQDATAALAHAYAALGRNVEPQKILHEWSLQSRAKYVSPYMVATVYASLGDKDKAFEYLEKAYQEKSSDLPYFLRGDFRIDSLRSDPRFQDLMRRMNFPEQRD